MKVNWEGSREGRQRDRNDRMALRAPMTLPTNKFSLDSFITKTADDSRVNTNLAFEMTTVDIP